MQRDRGLLFHAQQATVRGMWVEHDDPVLLGTTRLVNPAAPCAWQVVMITQRWLARGLFSWRPGGGSSTT